MKSNTAEALASEEIFEEIFEDRDEQDSDIDEALVSAPVGRVIDTGKRYPVLRLMSRDLRNRLKKLQPFMSKEETRYYLNGIFIRYKPFEVTLVATNGHILQEQKFEVDPEISEGHDSFAVICPRAAVEHLIKILPSKEEAFVTAQVLDGGAHIRFDLFEFEYITATVDGQFPDYERVVPGDTVTVQSGLRAGYLMAALRALEDVPVDICVGSGQDRATSPHLLTSSMQDGMKCVIMPMRQ